MDNLPCSADIIYDWPHKVPFIKDNPPLSKDIICEWPLFASPHAGFGDKVRCFSCQGELKKWRAGAVPLEEHRKMYKDCAAVK